MPQIAKYKALGGSIGAYKKTLSDIQSKEYAKDFASYKDVQRRSMYGAIGGTVANIIGIAQEVKGIKKLKGYAESAKGLSGVEERDGSYYSRISGKELSQEQLQSIGYMESLGIGTKYSEYEIPESNIVETKGGFKSIDAGETLDFPRRDLDLSDEILSNKEMETSPSISSNVNIEEPIVSTQKEDKPFNFFGQKDVIGEPRQYEMSDADVLNIVKDETNFFDNVSVAEAAYSEKFGIESYKLDEMARSFSMVESDNRNIEQIGGGPGKGLYQFESKHKNKEGKTVAPFQTALNRTERLYKQKGVDVPKWLLDAREHDSAMKLTTGQQKEVLLSDLYMKKGSDPFIKKAFESNDFKDLWLKFHWAGPQSEYMDRAKRWDKVNPSRAGVFKNSWMYPIGGR